MPYGSYSRSGIDRFAVERDWSWNTWPGPTSGWSSSKPSTNLPWSRTGMSRRGWKQLIKQHVNAATDYSISRYNIIERSPGSLSGYRKKLLNGVWVTDVMHHSGFYEPPVLLGAAGISQARAYNTALIELYKHAASKMEEFQSLTFLAEWKSTRRGIADRAAKTSRHIVKFATDFRRVRASIIRGAKRKNWGKTLRKLRDTSADLWLETMFGVVPLVSDVQDMAKAMAKYTAIGEGMYKGFGKTGGWGREERLILDSRQQINDPYFPWVPLFRYQRTIEEVDVRFWALLSHQTVFPRDSLGILAETSGLRFSALAPALWEATPWSFLIDYFSNIGDVVSSASFGKGNVVAVNVGIRKRTINRWWHTIDQQRVNHATDTVFGDNPGGSITHSLDNFVRLTNQPLDLPYVEWEIPISPIKWANMAALGVGFRNLFRRP